MMTQRIDLPMWQFRKLEPGSLSETVRLPHTAVLEPENITDPWEGKVEYTTTFSRDKSWDADCCIYLELTGAMQHCSVFLNGALCGCHHGGYDRFLIRLDDIREEEENVLRLELDNAASNDCPPGKPVKGLDFCYYSGLYREAALVITPALHISDPLAVAVSAGGGVFCRTLTASARKAELEIKTHIQHEVPTHLRFELPGQYGKNFLCRVRHTLRDAQGNALAARTSGPVRLGMNSDCTFTEILTLENPALWSVENPALYTLETELLSGESVADRHTLRHGIRRLEVSAEKGLCLNGKRLFINGTNRHQEYPHVGNAVPPPAQRRDAMLLKQGGRNFVRLAHYPQHQAFLDACDELGIAVIACIPGWQYYAVNDQFFAHLWRDVRSLIRDYRHHPCVVLWEVSLNETYPPNWINAELNRIAHEEFPGDQCLTCGDSLGMYEGWDVLFPRPGADPARPVLVREYGDWCFGGNNSTSRQVRGDGEKAMLQQVWNYLWSGNRAGKNPPVIGIADWVAWDYNRGYWPVTLHAGCGDLFRVPRYKYHFYRSQTAREPMVFPAAVWNREPGSRDKVVIFSNCDEVELRLNGNPLARRPPDHGPDTPYNVTQFNDQETAAADQWDMTGGNPFDGGNASYWPHPPFTFPDIAFEPGELTAVGYIGGKVAVEESIFTGGRAENLQLILREDGVPARDNDLLFAEVHLLDQANHPAAGEELEIALTCSGNARILGPAVKTTEAGIVSFLIRTDGHGPFSLTAAGQGVPETTIDCRC